MRCRNSTALSANPTTMPSARLRNSVSPKVTSSTTRIGTRTAQQRHERVLLRHVPGHRHQHTGQRGQRHVGRQRRGEQHEGQQHQRVQHPGHRTMRAGTHVGRSARNGAGHAQSAEQRGRRCWRFPAPPARSWIGAGDRSCCRPPLPTAGFRSSPAARTRMPAATTAASATRKPAATPAPETRAECRQSVSRWSPPAGAATSASTEASTTASNRFGQWGRSRRPSMMVPTVTAAMIIAAGDRGGQRLEQAPAASARWPPVRVPQAAVPAGRATGWQR